MQSFTAYAERTGIDVDKAVNAYQTAEYYGDRLLEPPSSQFDDRVIKAAENLLKSDPDEYWRDHEGREAYE